MVFSVRPRESISSRLHWEWKQTSYGLHHTLELVWMDSYTIRTFQCTSPISTVHGRLLRGDPRWDKHTLLGWHHDKIVYSKTFEEHVEDLRTVLRRLSKHGIKLKPSKCHLFQCEVHYLERIVSQSGHIIDQEGTKAVTSLKESRPRAKQRPTVITWTSQVD